MARPYGRAPRQEASGRLNNHAAACRRFTGPIERVPWQIPHSWHKLRPSLVVGCPRRQRERTRDGAVPCADLAVREDSASARSRERLFVRLERYAAGARQVSSEEPIGGGTWSGYSGITSRSAPLFSSRSMARFSSAHFAGGVCSAWPIRGICCRCCLSGHGVCRSCLGAECDPGYLSARRGRHLRCLTRALLIAVALCAPIAYVAFGVLPDGRQAQTCSGTRCSTRLPD
jgi:hypothetical protein